MIGSVLDGNVPLDSGVAHLSIEGAAPQSALIKEGNFLIPLAELRKADLSDVYQLTEGAIAKLTIRSAKGEASVSFNLKTNSVPLPPIRLGQNNDLTTPEIPQTSVPELNFYDLNNDGITNTADYAFILRNQGKQPENEQDPKQKADINQDGAIDQTDLELMSQKLKELSSQ